MSYSPIAGAPIQYQKSDGTLASGYYLKFYEAGTTTPLSMGIDSTPTSTLAKCQINSSGYPINGSSAAFIPHLNADYKIVLYKNSTDADADTTGNAEWVVDNVPLYETGGSDVWASFSATPTQTSAITFTLAGDQTSTFSVGTKLKLTDSTTIYAIVTDSAYSSVTTVTVLATSDLTGSLSAVEYAKTTDDGQTKGLELDARTYVVTSSRTITNDFKIPKGCLINISSSQTLTISGSVEAGVYQIFSGSGVVRGFDAPMIYPEWWGAVADVSTPTDAKSAIMAMFAYAENKTSGDDGCHIKFQPLAYAISSNITYKGNNTILEGYGTTIYNYGALTSAGYVADGLVIGNKQSADGEDGTNTSPFTYVRNVHVKGFYFELCRIGCYAIFAKSCSFEDLVGDGASTLAIGNDANGGSPTYDCYVKNIRQKDFRIAEMTESANFYIFGSFYSEDFVVDGVFSEDAAMAGVPANAKQITINNSKNGVIKNFVLDQVDKASSGFEIISTDVSSPSENVILRDGIVRRCLVGGTIFNSGSTNCVIDNVIFDDCVTGYSQNSSRNIVRNCWFKDSDTSDLNVETDANYNLFMNNRFEGSVTEQIAGRKAAQAWINNIGGDVQGYSTIGLSPLGSSIYKVRNVQALYAGPESNVTGNSTYYTLKSWTTETDTASLFDASTGVFTLPSDGIAGTFNFQASCLIDSVATAAQVELVFNFNSGTRIIVDYHNQMSTTGEDRIHLKGNITQYLGTGGTFQVEVIAYGIGADTADVLGSVGHISITEQRV